MGSRAKVIFTDGFHISPTVETTNEDLKERIARVLNGRGGPAVVSAMFVIQTAILKLPFALHNTPEGRSFGGTVATMMHESFWPGIERGSEGGVFFVWLNEKKIEYWGGCGFPDSEEFTKGIAQTEEL